MSWNVMKAITIWQPYAELIVDGRKRAENRSWKPYDFLIGQRIAIHAGLAKHTPGGDIAPDGNPWPTGCPRGVIVGTAVLKRAIGPKQDHFFGRCPFEDPESWRWFFENPIRVEPVEAKGRQGVWTVPRGLAERLSQP